MNLSVVGNIRQDVEFLYVSCSGFDSLNVPDLEGSVFRETGF
jgi:hypothetical protein